jgi:hypothetical protein
MVMERMPEGPPSSATVATDDAVARRALRVQMLATEHWSLLATRSLSWNEAFARASMFLALLSGAVVALALVAQATSFGEGFVLFALMLLPVVLFVGLATYVRLLEINNEDYVWVKGMNRLRGAYLEIDPDLARHFVTGVGEEADAIFKTFGSQPGVPGSLNVGNFHSFVTTPATIAFVDAMLGAALAAIVAVQLTDAMAPAAGVGVVSFIGISCALALVGYRNQAMAHLAPATRSSNQDVAPKKPQETSQ